MDLTATTELTTTVKEPEEVKEPPDIENPTNRDLSDYSSESDVLVIDESKPSAPPDHGKKPLKKVFKKRKRKVKLTKSKALEGGELVKHSNPYFKKSIFELSKLHHEQSDLQPKPMDLKSKISRRKRTKPKPKLREYAQYLGLQPTVQFKCSKCGLAGFGSLNSLQDHAVHCDAIPNTKQTTNPSYSSFKLTRKVFLCSACGTYYENWNLYLHMLEFHRRYICLYCLGMFSFLNELYHHIQMKHNFEPGERSNPDEFFSAYNEPCYITCCECLKVFNEQENFFYHQCVVTAASLHEEERSANNLRKRLPCNESSNFVNGEGTNSAAKAKTDDEGRQGENVLRISRSTKEYEAGLPQNLPNSKEAEDRSFLENDVEASKRLPEDPYSNLCSEAPNIYTIEPEEQTPNNDDIPPEPTETRKVPKLSLKLSRLGKAFVNEINVEPVPDKVEEKEPEEPEKVETPMETEDIPISNEPQIAGSDIPIVELKLEQPLDKFDVKVLLKKCLLSTAASCIYCNHATKISVNGRQLALHAMSDHRFAGTVNSITAEELLPDSFVKKFNENLTVLEESFFNLESTCEEAVTFSHLFECFTCRYTTPLHKELYMHNRKMHAKHCLLCLMCKSNFYSYSELICHLCPGLYILDYDLQFRCCMCVSENIPSAFRLMVHLRKRHHVCDVCLEMCHDQHHLSTHVWKHKLHHFCYRCGITYRNKPDITRHLFWKHGTESVMCKKCLQKKWPHMYHFCVPPPTFTCEECSLIFTRAMTLRVHKRIHSGEKKYECTVEGCEERFVAKKLLAKHELQHKEPPPPEPIPEPAPIENINETEKDATLIPEDPAEKPEEKPKPRVDVYDLPELNLSESDSDSEVETQQVIHQENGLLDTSLILDLEEAIQEEKEQAQEENQVEETETVTESIVEEEQEKTSEILMEDIWDNFKSYQAKKEQMETIFGDVEKVATNSPPGSIENSVQESEECTLRSVLLDHDYCIDSNPKIEDQVNEISLDLNPNPADTVDHDYCSPKISQDDSANRVAQSKVASAFSSNSSSDSDSSSCSCGSNCSCSSSCSTSSSDSSESDSSTQEGRRRQQIKKLERRENAKKKEPVEAPKEKTVEPVAVANTTLPSVETPIVESDLETTETETDEDFYDQQPHLLAKKLQEEKMNQLLAETEPPAIPNGEYLENNIVSQNFIEEPVKTKKKSKSKKRKKRKNERKYVAEQKMQAMLPLPPISLSLKGASGGFVEKTPVVVRSSDAVQKHNDSLRASKRRRIRNKFYGYSSEEEQEKLHKATSEKLPLYKVPPLTIKTPLPLTQYHHASNDIPIAPLNLRTNPAPLKTVIPQPQPMDSGSDSNDDSDCRNDKEVFSSSQVLPKNNASVGPASYQSKPPVIPSGMLPSANYLTKPLQPQLYCYCRCPYDEVSEMIGCDSSDCNIEWFHFECVGIMVPPKGQWFCPDCRKKKQQR